MEENQELDLITFVNENDEEVTMEVLDYFFYEGEEFAILTEYEECDEDCEETCEEACDCGHHHEHNVEAFIMRVVAVGEDDEEFLPIEDESLMSKLIDFVQNDLDSDEDDIEDNEVE